MPKNPHADFTPALEGYSGQGKFRFWCQMALPLTYDDSLSYYELLCKVVNYLNHTIEDVANAETNVSRLAEAYTQLQNYVNNYFDDLDIEAELRNVLDAMAEDGTLDDLLDPLVQDHLPSVVDDQIDDVVADQIGDAVAGQIDDVVAEQLPPLVDEGIPGEVSDWLTENVDPVGSAVVVDSSLTISGAAADAKVTGDELANLKTQLSNIDEVIDIEPIYETTGVTTNYPGTTILSGINLAGGKIYKLEAEKFEDESTIYIYVRDSNAAQLAVIVLSTTTTEGETTLTPQQDYENCYMTLGIGSASYFNKSVHVKLYCISENKIEELDAKTNNNENLIKEIYGDKFTAKNLLRNTIQSQTINGLTVTRNNDGTVTIDGTATANTSLSLSATLPAGHYALNGGPEGGSSGTYHIFGSKPGTGVTYYLYDNRYVKFELSEEQTVTTYIRVMNGITCSNKKFSPMIRNVDIFPYDDSYIEYGKVQIDINLTELSYRARSPWFEKKMNVIGDSIVAGSYGNFVNVIKEQLYLSVARNYGIGGCCIASTDQDEQYSPVVLRWDDMDDDADIVIVHAGTNDYAAQVPLGDANSIDITTFNGALNTIMTGLRQKYPSQLVIFSGILHRFNDGALTIPASAYREAMENRCLAKHFVYYDGYKWTGFDFVAGYYDHVLTSDGLHPNQLGAEILGRKLSGFINWM